MCVVICMCDFKVKLYIIIILVIKTILYFSAYIHRRCMKFKIKNCMYGIYCSIFKISPIPTLISQRHEVVCFSDPRYFSSHHITDIMVFIITVGYRPYIIYRLIYKKPYRNEMRHFRRPTLTKSGLALI